MAQSFLEQRTSLDKLLYKAKRSRGHMGIIIKLVFIMLIWFAFVTLIILYVGGPVLGYYPFLDKPPTYD